MSTRLLPLMLAMLLVVTTGCSTEVTRLNVNTVKDLSGRWNDTDSRLVAEAMIQQCLGSPWLATFSGRTGRRPEIIVGRIRNRSSEHISTDTFINDLQRALINSGRADFVASADQRQGVRDERIDMETHAAPDSRKTPGMEAGADYMLLGDIDSITDQEGHDKVVYYQVDLQLVDTTSNRIVWIGDKKIKKFVDRPRFGL